MAEKYGTLNTRLPQAESRILGMLEAATDAIDVAADGGLVQVDAPASFKPVGEIDRSLDLCTLRIDGVSSVLLDNLACIDRGASKIEVPVDPGIAQIEVTFHSEATPQEQ